MIDRAYEMCRQLLQKDTEKFKQVVQFLMEHETMSGEQFKQCMEGKEITASGESSLLDSFKTEQ